MKFFLYPKRIVKFSNSFNIPILQKYKIISHKSLKPLCKYHKLCLSVIIPHASTDVLITPSLTAYGNYLYLMTFFNFFNVNIKFILFFFYSLYHIRNDISGNFIIKMVYSSLIHSSWIFFPEFSLSYLAWIHVVCHYYKLNSLLMFYDKISIGIFSLFVYFILDKIDINEFTQKGYWIPLVISHIINVN